MYEILCKINGPDDVKKLSVAELEELAGDVRGALFNRLTKIGGHFGSNFGMVEMTIALHYVFDSPTDKIVFDVSHQSYTHKMLTGRKDGYMNDRFKDDSGYTNPAESEHDLFNVGHTSTSISLATGLAKGREIFGGYENVIAVIGDGSLSGGEALEGLSVAGSEIKGNLIIIVNDNQQSISETHGGIYKNLALLRQTKGAAESNMFKAIGLDYVYEENGNDIPSLIALFKKVKDIDHPIVVHVNTQKGKGYKPAETNKEAWHWCLPFDRDTGKPLFTVIGDDTTYVDIARETLLEKAKEDTRVVVVTPNMPGAIGLKPEERNALGRQFVDVGIAEEQAVAMASGIAKRGGRPVVVTNMTFMQRTYDQMSQDVCINDMPVTFLINYSSFAGLTDVTHLGIFGLPIFANIPNLVVFAPSSIEELKAGLKYSIEKGRHPMMILIPGTSPQSRPMIEDVGKINKFEVVKKGSEVAVIALGDFYYKGEHLCELLKKELNIDATFINPRFASGLDEKVLSSLVPDHKLVITLEDGVLEGGFGYKVASFFGDKKILVKNFGLGKEFYDRYNPRTFLSELGIDNVSIIKYVKKTLKNIG